MTEIMMIGEGGPRTILPESMWPGLARQGLGAVGWPTLAARARRRNFEQSDAGIWLPDAQSSQNDFDALRGYVDEQERRFGPDDMHPQIRALLGGVALTGQGCWVADGTDDSHLKSIMEIDAGNDVIDPLYSFSDLRQCDTPSCLYPRHCNAMLGTPNKSRVPIYPNEAYFMDDGQNILTAWGNRLPSVQESRLSLQALQKKCAPYADAASSLLTLNGISQLMLLPGTGCWMVNSYYMRPLGGTQYDAYGRLTFPSAMIKKLEVEDNPTKLAHRIDWQVLDNEQLEGRRRYLNHLCGFRACAYPGHLARSSHIMNVRHGELMEISKEMMFENIDIDDGLRLLRKGARGQGIRTVDQETFWE